VGQLPVSSVTQEDIWSSVHTVKMVKDIIQFFWSMRPSHEHVIHVIKLPHSLAGCPADYQVLEVHCQKDGSHR